MQLIHLISDVLCIVESSLWALKLKNQNQRLAGKTSFQLVFLLTLKTHTDHTARYMTDSLIKDLNNGLLKTGTQQSNSITYNMFIY